VSNVILQIFSVGIYHIKGFWYMDKKTLWSAVWRNYYRRVTDKRTKSKLGRVVEDVFF